MSENIKGLQLELQDFIWEQGETNKRIENMLEELVEKLAESDGLARCEEELGKRLEQVERMIKLLKSDMPTLIKRVNDLDSNFTDMRYKYKKD
ncbi:hypothetical protein [Paenibacillus sp. FSL R7-0333]|uniref:hypothetical protein n=1 Tax=Paenibacillus sp. FSL R7-0333 TaxID=1926587 RepID=UPI0009702069|nr:hypothetical protein BK146_32345 [Paenibacillus sp. FSL R7-0333]